MYPNLKAEMARNNILIEKLMEVTGKSRSGVSNNLNGKGAFTVDEANVKVIPNVTVGETVYQTVDSDAIDATKGEIKLKIGAAGEDGKYAIDSAEAVGGSAAGDAPAGDSTAVMGYVVAAVVALAAVVTVVSKKRSVEA